MAKINRRKIDLLRGCRQEKKKEERNKTRSKLKDGDPDGTRTRDLRRDRAAF
jgi:hypothetical protein